MKTSSSVALFVIFVLAALIPCEKHVLHQRSHSVCLGNTGMSCPKPPSASSRRHSLRATQSLAPQQESKVSWFLSEEGESEEEEEETDSRVRWITYIWKIIWTHGTCRVLYMFFYIYPLDPWGKRILEPLAQSQNILASSYLFQVQNVYNVTCPHGQVRSIFACPLVIFTCPGQAGKWVCSALAHV